MSGATTRVRASSPPAAADPVACRIRARRLGMGWSLKRLSEATGGLAPSFLFNIETGRKVPSEDVAARIARALEDVAHEATYRAWARAKSRGRTGRADHEALILAWEQLRRGFDGAAAAPAAGAGLVAEPGVVRVPVLAGAVDPGDDTVPPAGRVAGSLALDPHAYGEPAARARERYASLRAPFAFPIPADEAERAGLPAGYLAVVSRGRADGTRGAGAYVLRCAGRLVVVTAATLAGPGVPEELARAGLATPEVLRAAVIGSVELLLPDLRG